VQDGYGAAAAAVGYAAAPLFPLRHFVNFFAISIADLTPNFICGLLIRAENI
jgi:hypothetical protein